VEKSAKYSSGMGWVWGEEEGLPENWRYVEKSAKYSSGMAWRAAPAATATCAANRAAAQPPGSAVAAAGFNSKATWFGIQ
jgi:hypothetical protein